MAETLAAVAGLAAVVLLLLLWRYKRGFEQHLATAEQRARELANANVELRRSRERFELAVQGSKDGLWDWDLESSVVYFSPRWKSMIGHSDDEVPNRFDQWETRLHPDDHDRAVRNVQEYLRGETDVYEVEFRFRHKDGSYRWILARGVALRDSAGKPYRMAGSHTDITNRKRAEEALARERNLLRTLIDNLPDYIFVKDQASRFVLTNVAHLEVLGAKSLDDVVGKSDFDFFPRPRAEEYQASEQTVLSSGQPLVNRLEELTDRAGRRRWLLTSKVPLRDGGGKIVGLVGICRDFTTLKEAEDSLAHAKEAAELANQAKSEFLANMSHEVRTPMNAIIGLTELVLDTPLTAEQRDNLSLVKESADSLLAVINDILDFSKIEAHKLQLNAVPFRLRNHLSDTIKALALRAEEKGLRLDWQVAADVPEQLVGDPARLRQVLVNLVGNAVKFTERGQVAVAVSLADRATENGGDGSSSPVASAPGVSALGAPAVAPVSLAFDVSDTGIGIPPDKHALIFEAFAQVDGSSTRLHGGTGLGLTIARRLVEMMGGQIGVQSAPGAGSTFRFTLPFGTAPTSSEPSASSAESARTAPKLRPLQVLLAEDNPVNQTLVVRLLEKEGHALTLAGDGAEALAALEGRPFDLVLMDVQMPVLDGLEAAIRIRQREQGSARHVPILALTAHAMKGDRERCLAAGMDDYISKPIRASDLFEAMARLVPAAITAAPSTPPVCDLDAALAGVQGDQQLLGELASVLLREYPGWVRELHQAIAAHDPATVRRVAHMLKSSVGIFAATSAFDAAWNLESMGRREDLTDAATVCADLEAILGRLQPTLRALVESTRQAGMPVHGSK